MDRANLPAKKLPFAQPEIMRMGSVGDITLATSASAQTDVPIGTPTPPGTTLDDVTSS
ncbi:hypothetical protein [Halomonas sp. E19]|uniref:hypothetical protein n=1 Tax=unclassified Halomonas TaxID=2609666 RepID=UPI0040347B52